MNRTISWMAGAALAVAAVWLAGCNTQDSVSASAGPVKVEAASDPNSIEVERPEEFPLVAATPRAVHDDLVVNGSVQPDVSRNVPVNTLSGGRVVEIFARLGDEVRQGQLLLRINSPDLAQALADYQKAVADEVLARRALERAELLLSHGAIAAKDKETAEDAEQKAAVDMRTAAEHVRILGGRVDQPSPVVEVRAPVSGTIVEQNVTDAAGVKSLDNSPNLFTIADLSHVWVICDVYENNLPQVHLGDLADVRLTAYPERTFRARVGNIAPLLDPNTRTAKVRLQLANPGGIMKPGMFATATFVSQQARQRVFVPASALLRLHDKDWVFRPAGGKLFRRVEVQGGPALGDGTQEIVAGLRPGERIVANALQFSSSVAR